jgi:hypothetical protein
MTHYWYFYAKNRLRESKNLENASQTRKYSYFQVGIPTENNRKNTKILYFMIWEAFSRVFDARNLFLA